MLYLSRPLTVFEEVWHVSFGKAMAAMCVYCRFHGDRIKNPPAKHLWQPHYVKVLKIISSCLGKKQTKKTLL